MADEAGDDVGRVVRVTDGIRAAEEHLETNVGHFLAQGAEAFPGILAQKAHGRVESGAAPHFETEELRGAARHGVGDEEHVVGAHARGEERLVRVAEGGVGEKRSFLFPRPLGEFLRPELEQLLARSGRGIDAQVDLGQGRGRETRRRLVAFGFGVAVDRHVGQEMHQLRRAVAARFEFEEGRGFVDEGGRCVAGAEDGMRYDVLEERHVGLDPADAEFAQGAAHAVEGGGKRAAGCGDLDQQRIVKRRDRAARRAHARVEAHAETGGTAVGDDFAVIGREIVGRVLGGDAALHGVAVARHGVLRGQGELGSVQMRARGNEDLRADEVDPGDLLGHGMLDLNARVHLDEEPLVLVVVVEELDRAGVVVTDAFGDFDRGVAEFGADVVRQIDRRRDFHHLLVASLHRTVALVQMKHAAVRVTENLHFDVLGPRDVFLEENGGIAEGAPGFIAGFVEERGEIAFLAHHAHAASAAAEGRFDDERETDFLGHAQSCGAFGHRFLRAGEDGNTEFDRQGAGGGFVAHHFEQFGARSDERDTGFPAGAGELGVFGEEAVTGVDHVHPAFAGQTDDAFDVEVSSDRTFAVTDHVGFVGFEAVNGKPVFLRVNRDRAHAEFGGGAEGANGDLAAVGGEKGPSSHVNGGWRCSDFRARFRHFQIGGPCGPGGSLIRTARGIKHSSGGWREIFPRNKAAGLVRGKMFI